MRSRENRLDERNTNLRSAPPSHAATADGCVVKHKIEYIRNSDGTFHFEARTQVRQVEDRTIDRRAAALKGDACSLESAAAARFISALLLRVIHLFAIFRPHPPGAFPRPSSPACVHEGLGAQPCAKRSAWRAARSVIPAGRDPCSPAATRGAWHGGAGRHRLGCKLDTRAVRALSTPGRGAPSLI